MKTFRLNPRHPKFRERKEKLRLRAMKGVAARAAKRMASDEPIRTEWRGRLEWTITLHDRLAGTIRTLDLRRGQRRDRYALAVDGKPVRDLSATQLAGYLRRKLCIHVQP